MVTKPGHQPYLRLLRKLNEAKLQFRPAAETNETATAPSNSDAPATAEEELGRAQLLKSEGDLLALFKHAGFSPDTRVLLVVDQFEELFAFRREAAKRDQVASRDVAAAFVRLLLRTCAEPESRVHVVLTMRSDFIGDCEAFLGLPEAISRSQFLVPRLDRNQMAEAIERPASLKGTGYTPFTFELDLVNRIINEAGDRPDQLPLLQHALMRTWKLAVDRAGNAPVMLTSDDYQVSGGIEKALSLHADAAWQELQAKSQLIAQKLFVLLCDISPDGQITRRRPRVDEVMAVTGATLAELQEIVWVFQRDDRNFLLPPARQALAAETHLDISHEALLRRWERFANTWQEQERRDASELSMLVGLANFKKDGKGGNLSWRDLPRVEGWKKRVSNAWARRYVSPEEWEAVLAFIQVSKSQAKALKALVVCVFLLFGAAAFVSYSLKNRAQEQTEFAQDALARGAIFQ